MTSSSQAPQRRSAKLQPTREWEQELQSRFGVVAGMDEVGRGALAGPVCVGLAFAPPTRVDVQIGRAHV